MNSTMSKIVDEKKLDEQSVTLPEGGDGEVSIISFEVEERDTCTNEPCGDIILDIQVEEVIGLQENAGEEDQDADEEAETANACLQENIVPTPDISEENTVSVTATSHRKDHSSLGSPKRSSEFPPATTSLASSVKPSVASSCKKSAAQSGKNSAVPTSKQSVASSRKASSSRVKSERVSEAEQDTLVEEEQEEEGEEAAADDPVADEECCYTTICAPLPKPCPRFCVPSPCCSPPPCSPLYLSCPRKSSCLEETSDLCCNPRFSSYLSSPRRGLLSCRPCSPPVCDVCPCPYLTFKKFPSTMCSPCSPSSKRLRDICSSCSSPCPPCGSPCTSPSPICRSSRTPCPYPTSNMCGLNSGVVAPCKGSCYSSSCRSSVCSPCPSPTPSCRSPICSPCSSPTLPCRSATCSPYPCPRPCSPCPRPCSPCSPSPCRRSTCSPCSPIFSCRTSCCPSPVYRTSTCCPTSSSCRRPRCSSLCSPYSPCSLSCGMPASMRMKDLIYCTIPSYETCTPPSERLCGLTRPPLPFIVDKPVNSVSTYTRRYLSSLGSDGRDPCISAKRYNYNCCNHDGGELSSTVLASPEVDMVDTSCGFDACHSVRPLKTSLNYMDTSQKSTVVGSKGNKPTISSVFKKWRCETGKWD